MTQVRKPLAMSSDLSVQHVGDETLVYDERRHRAFCMDRIASAVWAQCDGFQTAAEIAENAGLALAGSVSEDAVFCALAQFERDGLLQPTALEGASQELPFAALSSISRRAMLARLGAGAALTLPVVAMVMAPTAAQAYNGCVNCAPGTVPVQPSHSLSDQPTSNRATPTQPGGTQLGTQ